MNDLRRISRYAKPYLREILLAIILLGLVVVADLSIPRLIQVIIDEGVAQKDMNKIITTSLLMIGASILSAIFMVGNTVFAVRAARSIEADIRESVFKKIQRADLSFLSCLGMAALGPLQRRISLWVHFLQMALKLSKESTLAI